MEPCTYFELYLQSYYILCLEVEEIMIDSVIETDAMFKHLEELGIKMEILLRDIMNILLLRENEEINFRKKTLTGVYFLKKA